MHIIIVTDSYALSGGARQAVYQANSLYEMGYTVTVIRQKLSALQKALSSNIRQHEYVGGAFNMAQAIRDCLTNEPTILHSYHNLALKVLSFWGMIWKMEYPALRCVAHRGVSVHPRNPFPYWATGIDCFLPNSYAVAKQIRHFLPWSPHLISVIYNGIPQERVTPTQHSIHIASKLKIPHNAYTFISIVNSSERKGARELLKAFEILQRNAHLILIGVNQEFIEQHISNKDILARIHQVTTSEVADYLVQGKCFIFPSRSFDSLPNVVLEAMGVGLPIIATNVGGIPELIRGNGILIPPKNIKALVEAMEYMIDNQQETYQLAERSKEEFAKYTIEERTNMLIQLYTKLLSQEMR